MESIILALDEVGKKRTFVTAINISDILTTENPEEAVTFPSVQSARESIAMCREFFKLTKYRNASGSESIDLPEGSITIIALSYKRTFTPMVTTVMVKE